jgi:hypothetical protein
MIDSTASLVLLDPVPGGGGGISVSKATTRWAAFSCDRSERVNRNNFATT